MSIAFQDLQKRCKTIGNLNEDCRCGIVVGYVDFYPFGTSAQNFNKYEGIKGEKVRHIKTLLQIKW